MKAMKNSQTGQSPHSKPHLFIIVSPSGAPIHRLLRHHEYYHNTGDDSFSPIVLLTQTAIFHNYLHK